MSREEIAENYPDLMCIDGHDDAIIGIAERIKFYPHGNYFIIYRINKTVEILRIISSYRNIPKLLLAR